MKKDLEVVNHINHKNFPCIMGKAVHKIGLLDIVNLRDEDPIKELAASVQENLKKFLLNFSQQPLRPSSFVITFNDSNKSFDEFEIFFWKLLKQLRTLDRKTHKYDPRVSSDPVNPKFSFSLQGEAFFILLLHPDSPRFSRQTKPALVFNLHQQFEQLRQRKKYLKIRNLIRKNDIALQGAINPMLKDFGEKSEILQYTGSSYNDLKDIEIDGLGEI